MKSLLIFCCLFITLSAKAQYKLVFINADSSKTIIVKQKDLARLSYNGYMKQPQEVEGIISVVTDSTISLSPRKKLFKKRAAAQTIRTRDITGFRRYSNFRQAGEIIYGVASVGITGAVSAIISKASVPTAVTFLSAAGTATVTTAIKGVFLSHKVKNHLGKKWTIRIQPDQAQPAN